MYSSQQQQEEASFNDERAVITSELHAIVDNLQPDPPPQVAPTRRPFRQRTVIWQVPLCLIVLAVVLMYNPRVDNCNGFKITYKRQVLCISNAADFFLFVENFTCDFIENGKSIADSLTIDEDATGKMKAYYDKYDFSIKKQPIEAEVLRGMRGQYDSTSFCKNITKAYWNVGIRYYNSKQKDSFCYYFNKIYDWSWKDSVLTAEEQNFIKGVCSKSEEPVAYPYPNSDFVEGECCTINYDNIAFRSKPLNAENMRTVNNRTQTQKETPQSVRIDNQTLIGTLANGEKAFFLGKAGSFFKIRLEKNNQIGYIATSYKGISTLLKGCKSSIPASKGSLVNLGKISNSQGAKTLIPQKPMNFINDNLNMVLNNSNSENKLAFLFFTASYCSPCQMMLDYTFKDSTLTHYVSKNYIASTVNIESSNGYDVKNKFEVKALPAIVVIDKFGRVLGKYEESMSEKKMLEVLKKHRLNPTPLEKQPSYKDSLSIRNQSKPVKEYGITTSVAKDYIERFKTLAISEQLTTSIPASIILGQALLESLAGQSALAIDANNHFGLRCQTCSEKEAFLATDDEYDKNGKLIYSKFYRFKTPEESYAQHAQLLTTNQKYRPLFSIDKTDYRAWALGLQKTGYSTSSSYAEKLISIIEKYELNKFDKQYGKTKKN